MTQSFAAHRIPFDFPRRQADDFLGELEAFTFNGERTRREARHGVPYLINEFWTARQRQSHALHEISYRACFKAELPAFFIHRLTEEGETVYDPFMGRGTTPLQAILMGRAAIGADINPLSVLLCRPRLDPPAIGDVVRRLSQIDWRGAELAPDHELLTFYHPETLKEILALRGYLLDKEACGRLDATDDWVRMVALNRLTGHSPGFFSVYSLPPNQAVSLEAQRRINAKRNQTPPRRSVPDIIVKKSRSLLADGRPPKGPLALHVAAAHCTPQIRSGSIDLVVTSPPFLDVVQYAADNWLRCWFAGIDASAVEIAMHRKPEAWSRFVRAVFGELARVVRPGGHVAFEVGEVRGGAIALDTLALDALSGLPFEPLCVVVNVQEFTKTANCWGVSNNAKGTNSNCIVVARRQ